MLNVAGHRSDVGPIFSETERAILWFKSFCNQAVDMGYLGKVKALRRGYTTVLKLFASYERITPPFIEIGCHGPTL